MSQLKCFPFLCLTIAALFSTCIHAVTFVVQNNCNYVVWGAASPGGGQQMSPGALWTFDVPAGQKSGRVWARTGCQVTGPNGLRCDTGDCGGLLHCQGYGSAPNTLAEYGLNGYANLDYIDISLVAGFNVPMSFIPTSNGCSKGPTCAADVNAQCPNQLRAKGGCKDPCTVFGTDNYCCNSGSCGPTDFSRYFKSKCPSAYSYPTDTTLFTCPANTNYKVTFCP